MQFITEDEVRQMDANSEREKTEQLERRINESESENKALLERVRILERDRLING